MSKSKDTSKIRYIDHNPTQIVTNDGVVNPDKSGRLSLVYTDKGQRFRVDNKEVSLEDGFALTTGQDKVPKIGTFGGVGDGKLQRAYESDEDYRKRMEK